MLFLCEKGMVMFWFKWSLVRVQSDKLSVITTPSPLSGFVTTMSSFFLNWFKARRRAFEGAVGFLSMKINAMEHSVAEANSLLLSLK